MSQRRPRILIVEGNAISLRRQGLARAIDTFCSLTRQAVDAGTINVLRFPINSAFDVRFGTHLASVVAEPYDGILLFGHGTSDGLMEVAPGLGMSWADIGAALAPLKPRVLFALSCWAGSAGSVKALLDAAPSIGAVMGSPFPLTTQQALLGIIEFFVRCLGVDVPAEMSGLVTLLNAGLSGGLVWTRTREEVAASAPGTLEFQDLAAALVKAFLALELDDPPPRRRRRLLNTPVRSRSSSGRAKRSAFAFPPV